MEKKRISWITAECFLDVDLPIIAKLKDVFQIYWQIILPYDCTIDNKALVSKLIPESGDNLEIEFVRQTHRMRDVRTLFQYLTNIKKAKAFKPDLYYLSNYQMPYGIWLYRILLPLSRVVVPCHNVSTPKGAAKAGFTQKYTKWWIKTFKNIQVFSKSQKCVLESLVSDKNILYASLALKDYGEPTIKQKPTELIRFLNFGIIQKYKRADLLIEAGNILYERGYRKIRIHIAGNCKTWEQDYAPLIKHPDIFEIDIKRIPNEDVPNLFAESHYFVMPYQDIAQSGAITVAFCYNLPTIVSDIKPFKEFVVDGETGLSFKSEDAVSLADKMQYVIDNHQSIYSTLQQNQRTFVEHELSLESIVAKYTEYFEKL